MKENAESSVHSTEERVDKIYSCEDDFKTESKTIEEISVESKVKCQRGKA